MELKIRMQHGLAYDLCLVIPREELEECLLSFPYWDKLIHSYGYVRHPMGEIPKNLSPPASHDPETGEWMERGKALSKYKLPLEEHLGRNDLNLLDNQGQLTRRAILIGNRNLGNNSWFVAWHRAKQPRCFHLKGEPIEERIYSCLVWRREGGLTIEAIKFQPERGDYRPCRALDGQDLSAEIIWCTYGQQILREGGLVDLEEILEQFYDIRHALYFPTTVDEQERELRRVYEGYPNSFQENVLREWRMGRPRSRYFHNVVGLAPDKVIILQRHGTIEEFAHWLLELGAEDGLILDNGGSVFCWGWWPIREVVKADKETIRRTGHLLFSAPDWRPDSSSLLAFVLKGPVPYEEPRGSVAFAVG